MGDFDADLALFGSYVSDAEAAAYHAKWVKGNPGEAQAWASFRDAVLAGQQPVVPSLRSRYGQALVHAGEMGMSISRLIGSAVPPIIAPVHPPDPPQGWTGPITISAGGTYQGLSPSSDSTTPAVTITTTDPVVIRESWIRNTSSGDLIKGENFQVRDLTLERTYLYGGTGRVFDVEGSQNIVVRNCVLDKTGGMKIGATLAGCTILVTRNRHTNILGPSLGANYLTSFFKVVEVQNATITVSWNEVVNEYNLSEPEDIVSLFKSAYADVHDNYFQHNSTPGNAYNTSSQGTITIDYPDGVGPVCHDIHVFDNQMVDTVNAVLIPPSSYDILVERNRLIQDGKLPNGTQMGNGYSGWAILGPVTNCHMHDNITGFVNRDGVRYDWHDTLDAPEGRAAEIAKNTTLSDPITAQMEADEWTTWQSKLAANGITVGI